MLFLIIFGAVGVLGAALLTPLIREPARRWELVDWPDGLRKVHSTPTPHVGGVAIFTATAVALLIALVSDVPGDILPVGDARRLVAIAAAGTVIFLVGLWDDIRGLSPWTKFWAQLGVSVAVVLGGVRFEVIESLLPQTAWLAILADALLTVGWLVVITNALNLLDGSDGVAAGAAVIPLVAIALISHQAGATHVALVCAIVAGSAAGFLFFNFPPASIFMGDSGSLFLGFTMATLSVEATHGEPRWLAVPALAFGLLLLDTALAVLRRMLGRRSIFLADRAHLHHWLRDRGLSPTATAVVIYLASFALSVASVSLAVAVAH